MVWRWFNLIEHLLLFSAMWPYLWSEYLFKCKLHCHLIVPDSSDYHTAREACRFTRTSPVVAELPFEASRWWYSSSEMYPESRGRPGCPVFVSFLFWSYFFKLSLPFISLYITLSSVPCLFVILDTIFCSTSSSFHLLHPLSNLEEGASSKRVTPPILHLFEDRKTVDPQHAISNSSYWLQAVVRW